MPRIRTIKPGFFTDDELGELPPLTRLFFVGLWTVCDREGRCDDRPKRLKVELMPYDNCDVDKMLDSLQSAGFVIRYEADGKAFIQVHGFTKHQQCNVQERASTIPAPSEDHTRTIEEHTKHSKEGKGTDIGKGKNPPLSPQGDSRVSEIVSHLNTVAGRKFKPDGKYPELRARLNAGATAAECKAVIDSKCGEWLGTEQAKYLTPITLFRPSHWDTYLEAAASRNGHTNGQAVQKDRVDNPDGSYEFTNEEGIRSHISSPAAIARMKARKDAGLI